MSSENALQTVTVEPQVKCLSPTGEDGLELSLSRRGTALVGQEMFKVLDRARKLEEEGGARVYHFELGNPNLQPPAVIIETAVKALQDGKVGYTCSAGMPEFREALAARYARTSGRPIDASNIVISPANHLISQFLDLTCNEGDRVVLFSPAFPSYLAAAAHIGLTVVDVSLNPRTGFELTENDIKKALSTNPKAIIVNSANNPTGAVYERDILESLAWQCAKKGIWLLSDETYGEVWYDRPFYSLADLDYPQLVIISSFSKIFSVPGFRIGYAIASKAVVEKLTLSNSTLFSCLPEFTQLGCVAGLNVMDDYVPNIRARFSSIMAKCASLLNESGVFQCFKPRAGFYFFLDIGVTGLDDMTFSNRLLEEMHTAVTPGRSFGGQYKNAVRIAVCGETENIIPGLHRIISFARTFQSASLKPSKL